MAAPVSDATAALVSAIRAAFGSLAGAVVVEEIRSRAWASVTFRGARHELRLRLEGAGADAAATRFLDGLEAKEFVLPGHILADIGRISIQRLPGSVRIALEALTVEDRQDQPRAASFSRSAIALRRR